MQTDLWGIIEVIYQWSSIVTKMFNDDCKPSIKTHKEKERLSLFQKSCQIFIGLILLKRRGNYFSGTKFTQAQFIIILSFPLEIQSSVGNKQGLQFLMTLAQFPISNILLEIQSSVGNRLGLHGGILEQTDTSLFCAHQLFRLYICQIQVYSSSSITKGVMFYRFLITLLALHFTFVGLSVGRVSN